MLIGGSRLALVLLLGVVLATGSGVRPQRVDTSSLALLQLGAHKVDKNKSTGNTECPASGQLYFAHIMKDGGSSVGKYLECICEEANCNVFHAEAGHDRDHSECDPSVCTGHTPVMSPPAACGSSFEKAAAFTLVRNPIDRVYSFYTYYRYTRKFEYFQKSLLEILQDLESCQEHATKFLCQEFHNGMMGKYLSNSMTIDMSKEDDPDELAQSWNTIGLANVTNLEKAQEALGKLDAVFLTEDATNFPTLFEKSGLPFSEYGQKCEFLHRNGKVCEDCAATDEELQLIKKINWLDMRLYNYAATLPNFVS